MSPLDRFISALEARGLRPRKSADGYISRCPSHEDKEPSLSFREGDTGLLVKCHAGCTFAAILDALGLQANDLFDSQTGESQPGDFESRIETTYDYTDEDGEPLYQAVRLRDPKSFRQRRKMLGKWEWALGDTRRVLYRLQEVRAAAARGQAIWIVEGEKDVHTLEALGYVATCSPMGAGKWRDEYADSLAGIPFIVIVADCDEPGRKHAEEIAASLHGRGFAVKVLDLAPDRTDGYDVTDYAAEGDDDDPPGALRKLANETPRWKPQTPRRRIIALPGRDFYKQLRPPNAEDDLLGPILRRNTRVGIAGFIGEGKTSLMLQMVAASAYGEQFFSYKGRGGDTRWLIVDLEQGESEIHRRLEETGIAERNGNVCYAHVPDGLRIDHSEEDRAALEDLLAQGWHGVVLDPAYALLSSEPETELAARRFASTLDYFHRKYDFCLLVPMHTRKPQPRQIITLADVYGWSTIARNMQVALGVQIWEPWVSMFTILKDRTGDVGPKGKAWKVAYDHKRLFHQLDGALPGQEEIAA